MFDPDADSVLSEGDVLLFNGPEDGVNLIREIAGAPPLPEPPEVDLPALSELDRAVDILIEMKNSSEVAVGLAYSALLFQRSARWPRRWPPSRPGPTSSTTSSNPGC